MNDVLRNVYGSVVVVRPPVPATVNKAGANYKSEVAHLSYSPRAAFGEWLTICDAILACGGDALFQFEDTDEPFLDASTLRVDDDGNVFADDSTDAVGNLDHVQTGRVFAANGPWVTTHAHALRAVLQHMLPHRQAETGYYRDLLAAIAAAGEYELELIDNPPRWEGMADVAVVGDRVVLSYAVPGHYDEGHAPKSPRSSLDGVKFAADRAGVPEEARIYVELRYPHFHGDTVHFGARPTQGDPLLVHYQGGLWGDGAERIRSELGDERIVAIGKTDAVENYCGNSRQIGNGLLLPAQRSESFLKDMQALGLEVHSVPLSELFGKAGGGPGCATLYMPADLRIPETSDLRYSVRQSQARARLARVPERLNVSPGYFAARKRG